VACCLTLKCRNTLAERRLGVLEPITSHGLRQQPLAFLQRQGPHVLILGEEQVERDEARWATTEHEIVEPRPAVLFKGDDFTVEDVSAGEGLQQRLEPLQPCKALSDDR
jgi:hypothetical protein